VQLLPPGTWLDHHLDIDGRVLTDELFVSGNLRDPPGTRHPWVEWVDFHVSKEEFLQAWRIAREPAAPSVKEAGKRGGNAARKERPWRVHARKILPSTLDGTLEDIADVIEVKWRSIRPFPDMPKRRRTLLDFVRAEKENRRR
jgi:hypothetical protein